MSTSYITHEFEASAYKSIDETRVHVFITTTTIGPSTTINLSPEEVAQLRDKLTEVLQVVHGYKVTP